MPKRAEPRSLLCGFPVICIFATLTLLSGCTDLGYYWQAASGHLSLLAQKEDIEKLIASPDTQSETRHKLELVRQVREFAVTELKLPQNSGYTGYTDLGRSYVTVAVTAAKPAEHRAPRPRTLMGFDGYGGLPLFNGIHVSGFPFVAWLHHLSSASTLVLFCFVVGFCWLRRRFLSLN